MRKILICGKILTYCEERRELDKSTVEVEGGSPGKNVFGTGNLRGSNFRYAEPLSGGYVIHLFGSAFSFFAHRGGTILRQKGQNGRLLRNEPRRGNS